VTARQRALQAFLRGCDVPARVLARDPTGASWLPADLRRWALDDPAAQRTIQRFVAAELALSQAPAPLDDAAFVAAVVERAQRMPRAAAGVDLRATILFVANLLAVVCAAYVLSWAVPGAPEVAGGAVEQALAAAQGAAADAWGLLPGIQGHLAGGIAVLALGVGLLLARRVRLPHTLRA